MLSGLHCPIYRDRQIGGKVLKLSIYDSRVRRSRLVHSDLLWINHWFAWSETLWCSGWYEWGVWESAAGLYAHIHLLLTLCQLQGLQVVTNKGLRYLFCTVPLVCHSISLGRLCCKLCNLIACQWLQTFWSLLTAVYWSTQYNKSTDLEAVQIAGGRQVHNNRRYSMPTLMVKVLMLKHRHSLD